jgi:hypothetical protein
MAEEQKEEVKLFRVTAKARGIDYKGNVREEGDTFDSLFPKASWYVPAKIALPAKAPKRADETGALGDPALV